MKAQEAIKEILIAAMELEEQDAIAESRRLRDAARTLEEALAARKLSAEHAGALRRKAAHGGTPSYLREAILAALAALGESAQ